MSKKKDEKILELQYNVEMLQDEVDHHEEMARINHERLWTIIQENDRLTLRYEPYRPPGHETEEYDFYELIDENKSLTQNVLDKVLVIKEVEDENKELKAKITSLEYRNQNLANDLREIRQAVLEMKKETPKKRVKKFGVVSFDIWPPRDWFRFNWTRWNPGQAAQLCIGPLRIDWQAI